MVTLGDTTLVAAARWSDLASELDLWGDEGRIATLWWRDDDAAAPGARLDRLLEIAREVPLALAVIPAAAEPGLAAGLGASSSPSNGWPSIAVLQHGWRHANHVAGPKKSEFPAERSGISVTADLSAGRARLTALFGSRALAVMAPPWNRFDERFLPLLASCGIAAVSRLGPRRAAWPSPGVFEANVHVDLVAWKGGRGFIGEAAALGGLVGHLRARRRGAADRDEPSGILTHHLVHDEATSAFLGRLVALTAAHPAARWLAAGEVFAPGRDGAAPGARHAPGVTAPA
jgi:hypothetical protein